MTDETEQNTREDPEEMPELGLVLRIFYWFLLWKAGGASRDRRREKGLPPPSTTTKTAVPGYGWR
jgi:hypothetical protein